MPTQLTYEMLQKFTQFGGDLNAGFGSVAGFWQTLADLKKANPHVQLQPLVDCVMEKLPPDQWLVLTDEANYTQATKAHDDFIAQHMKRWGEDAFEAERKHLLSESDVFSLVGHGLQKAHAVPAEDDMLTLITRMAIAGQPLTTGSYVHMAVKYGEIGNQAFKERLLVQFAAKSRSHNKIINIYMGARGDADLYDFYFRRSLQHFDDDTCLAILNRLSLERDAGLRRDFAHAQLAGLTVDGDGVPSARRNFSALVYVLRHKMLLPEDAADIAETLFALQKNAQMADCPPELAKDWCFVAALAGDDARARAWAQGDTKMLTEQTAIAQGKRISMVQGPRREPEEPEILVGSEAIMQARRVMWQSLLGRPVNESFGEVDPDAWKQFGTLKVLRACWEPIQLALNLEGHLLDQEPLRAAELFDHPDEVARYLNKGLKSTTHPCSVHQALQFALPPQGATWNKEAWKTACLKHGGKYARHLVNAARLEVLAQQTNQPCPPASVEQLNTLAEQLKFERMQENPLLATLFVKYAMSDEAFDRALALIDQVKHTDHIPGVNARGTGVLDGACDLNAVCDALETSDENRKKLSNYYIAKLPANDARVLVMGKIVQCCNHLDGETKDLAAAAMTSPDVGVYAVFKKGGGGAMNPAEDEIVAKASAMIAMGSHALPGQKPVKAMLLNSWERIGPDYEYLAAPFLHSLAECLLRENPDLDQVRVGGNKATSSMLEVDDLLKPLWRGSAPDSKDTQHLICSQRLLAAMRGRGVGFAGMHRSS